MSSHTATIVEPTPTAPPPGLATMAGAGLSVGVLTTWRQFLGVRRAWERLAATDPDGVLLGHDWTAQAWKASPELRAGETPLILAATAADGQLAAVLPLRHNQRTKRLCFLEEARSQRLDLLAAPGCAAAAWRLALAELLRRGGWDRLDLQFLRPGGATLAGAACAGLGLAVNARGTVRQRRLDLTRTWSDIEAGFSTYLRANFRRRQKRLEARGRLRLTACSSGDGLWPALQACFALEKQGWKGAQATAILDVPDLARFYRQLACRLAPRGELRLFCLWLDQRLVAFEYCVADPHSRRLSSLKIAYDEEFRTASPGTVLRWLLLRDTAGQFATYEFLGDDAAWKGEWTPELTELQHLRIYNRSLGGWAWRARARAYAVWRAWRARAKPMPP
ncbi:MAG: GNAT family N-acetyltransferase [Terriglobales bacterium]